MKAAEHRNGEDTSLAHARSSNRLLLAQSLMRACCVVEADELRDEAAKVTLVQDEDAIENLSPERSREAFSVERLHEIACPRHIVPQERGPVLSVASGASMAHVPLNRPLTHADAQLEQLAANPLGTPQRISRCHFTDQGGSGRHALSAVDQVAAIVFATTHEIPLGASAARSPA
jgi:hypothetical protein